MITVIDSTSFNLNPNGKHFGTNDFHSTERERERERDVVEHYKLSFITLF